jgi:hypothetical protein
VPVLNSAHGPNAVAWRPTTHGRSRPNPAVLTACGAGATHWARSPRDVCPGRRGGASADGSPAAHLPLGQGRGHEGGGRGAPGKVGNGVAHRGGRASVGWRGETDAATFRRWREVGRRLAMLHITLWFCEWEEEVRSSPNARDGEEGARWRLSPRRGDGVGGVAECSVQSGAPMVGAVRKATGRGFCPWGASE